MASCPFCRAYESGSERVVAVERSAGALEDAFPCAPGHLLVTPVRHVARLADLTVAERQDLFALVGRLVCEGMAGADGITLGMNDGAAAGQTVPHAHVHLIPRTRGDVPDPRGGVRMLFPAGKYWT